jgi:hypothetical protein
LRIAAHSFDCRVPRLPLAHGFVESSGVTPDTAANFPGMNA